MKAPGTWSGEPFALVCLFLSLIMSSLRDNEKAFDRYKLRPRILCDVEEVDTTTEIFNTKVSTG